MQKLTFKLGFLALAAASASAAQASEQQYKSADEIAKAIEREMISWRRDIHAHPELGNAETRTSRLVAAHLKRQGLQVRTGVAVTGVVAVLDSGRPGPVVALRADMDGLPVKEEVDLAFASKATGQYRGETVPVMHACGHDAHVAILMATAEVLSKMRSELTGKVVFLFQPAEEGPSTFEPGTGSSWGAKAMIEQGAFDNPKVDVTFGLHVIAGLPTGMLAWRSGPLMASADSFKVTVHGQQTHGAMPWRGVDPIVSTSQIINGLQSIVSRQIDISKEPAILSVGQVHGGVRFNIIPDSVWFEGTIRAFDEGMRADIYERIKRTSEQIASASGATAEAKLTRYYDVTVNDPDLTKQMTPTLIRVAGGNKWNDQIAKSTGGEDFSEFGKKGPALFLFLGITPPAEVATAAANHSPLFRIDESGLLQGVRALTHLTIDYLSDGKQQAQ
ncbi:carboxypeptidase Ss1. Metallo peptidase. MEROPS family M20D [Sphingobium sp. AP50]|uniref:amidohydrolase n=1 Tax=Sphingobium sp. AP50 TaxID=1884369 RepID=UPI0008ACD3F2|nr:amidohydrolase [Sphingobium sp. AP50]SEJ72571.1 carboxypeptidase Ss1. Metallo peptidase. MEROPS family M20D [Sphingobium sp. AP50]